MNEYGRYKEGIISGQLPLFPGRVEDYVEMSIAEDNDVRIIKAFVYSLDLKKLGIKGCKKTGAKSYDPRDLLSLLIYGYKKNIRSSRKLEESTYINIEVMWLLDGLKPNFRTISDFRKVNIKALKEAFREYNRDMVKLEILKTSEGALDGTVARASNAKDKNFTVGKLDTRIELSEKKIKEIDKYLKELEENTEKEEHETEEKMKYGEIDKQYFEEKVKKREEREREKKKLNKYKEYRKELKETGESQKSLTDKDSKLMKSKNGGFDVNYNIQAVVDTESHIVAAVKGINKTDIGMMEDMAEEAKGVLGVDNYSVLADGGYVSSEDIVNCLEKGTVPILPKTEKNKGYYKAKVKMEEVELTEEDKKGLTEESIRKCLRSGVIPEIYKDVDMYIESTEEVEKSEEKAEGYSEEEAKKISTENNVFVRVDENEIVCPEGQKLYKKSEKKNRNEKRYWNKMACESCKNKCTKNKYKEKDMSNAVAISGEGVNQRKKEKVKKKKVKYVTIYIKPNEEQYAKRKSTVEHVFGTIKQTRGMTYFLLRGLEKINAEISLGFLAYNITRSKNIKGTQEIVKYFENKKKQLKYA